jgi:hypothetical protein
MAENTPKIVMMGKGSVGNGSEIKLVNSIIKTIQPSVIPSNLLHGLFVTLDNDQRYKVSGADLGEGLDYDEIERYLINMGLNREIKLVEVVIDLDAVQNMLKEQTDQILDPIFNQD